MYIIARNMQFWERKWVFCLALRQNLSLWPVLIIFTSFSLSCDCHYYPPPQVNPTWLGIFGIFNVRVWVWGGGIMPRHTLILVNFWPFFEKWLWFKNNSISTHFYIKNTPGIISWSKTFQIPEEGRVKTRSGARFLVLKNFGSKICPRFFFYLKVDWN